MTKESQCLEDKPDTFIPWHWSDKCKCDAHHCDNHFTRSYEMAYFYWLFPLPSWLHLNKKHYCESHYFFYTAGNNFRRIRFQ